jgi:putative transposase
MKRDTGPNALRRGRYSRTGANYFVTVCTDKRQNIIGRPVIADKILAALREPQVGGIWRLRCCTIMPDHIHFFIELGSVHSLSRAVGRFKTLTKASLIAANTAWQENFYDHQLRTNEAAEPVIRYIFLNPYEAGLIQPGTPWPWFHCCDEDWTWFSGLTDSGQPFPEWLT